MNGRKYLMPYPEERALEDVAFGHGLAPVRIFALLLPVWQVEVRATTTDGRPYALIDRYLERGIAEAGLGTTAELARFFALDEALVDRALRFLGAIGHVRVAGGRLALTELGAVSQRDGRCYVVEREDRRKMYFDAFRSYPLSRAHYDASVVTLLAPHEIPAMTAGDRYRTFTMVHSPHGFRHEALAELAARADRDHYNLPVRIEHPQCLSEECVYLPTFVVRALDRGGRIRHLVYSQAADVADPDLGALCETTPEISHLLESEARAARPERTESRVTEWLRRRGLDGFPPVRLDHGAWRVVLPAGSFEPKGRVPLGKMGSFAVLGTDLLHIWCADRNARERALLERLDAYLGPRARGGDQLAGRIARMVSQLDVGEAGPRELAEMALAAGRRGLAARLTEALGGDRAEK